LLKSSKVLNISISSFEIPAQETTYVYQFIKFPTDKKYHILSYRPLLGTTKDQFAHHAVLYACSPDLNDKIEAMASKGPIEANSSMIRCLDFYMLSVPWATPYIMPPEAALPFGNGSYAWMMLEMHFNNPEYLKGFTDAGSGISVEYSDQLRPHDMGLITLSQLQLQIPPGMAEYSAATSYCLGSCTKLRLSKAVNLVDQTYHMHGLGKSAITRRFRDKKELSPLGNLRTFDYKYQPFLGVPAAAQVLLPGDTLAFTCTFDSTSRATVTKEGPGTRDEMCFHWIYYWPTQPDFAICSSLTGNATRPAIGVCAGDLTPLFGLMRTKEPQARQALQQKLYKSGRLMNVTEPNGFTPYVQQCSKGSVVQKEQQAPQPKVATVQVEG